jgi:hypothetical protein
MKRISILTLVLLSVTTTSFAFDSGDKIRCFDDVSGETSTIKITDLGDEKAYVKFSGNSYSRFYSTSRVNFRLSDTGAIFQMISEDHTVITEEIFLPYSIKNSGHGYGDYADRGDSRSIECELL